MAKLERIIPLNRVEGDLELHLELDDDTVSEVRSVGTMYRGIENLMKVDVSVFYPGADDPVRVVTGFIGEPLPPGQSNTAWNPGQSERGGQRR